MESCSDALPELPFDMKAILTSEALSFIPEPIRRKLHLKVGDVLDFDEAAPFLNARTFSANSSDEFEGWLKASVGLGSPGPD